MRETNIADVSHLAHACGICCEHIRVGITNHVWEDIVNINVPNLENEVETKEMTEKELKTTYFNIIEARIQIILLHLNHHYLCNPKLWVMENPIIAFTAFSTPLRGFYYYNEDNELESITIIAHDEQLPHDHSFVKKKKKKKVIEPTLKLLN